MSKSYRSIEEILDAFYPHKVESRLTGAVNRFAQLSYAKEFKRSFRKEYQNRLDANKDVTYEFIVSLPARDSDVKYFYANWRAVQIVRRMSGWYISRIARHDSREMNYSWHPVDKDVVRFAAYMKLTGR